MKYDFLIVGAGIAGATCARLLTDKGYKCLIVEKRPFVGGTCITTKEHGIDIHVCGPHILHTNNKSVWDFISKYDNIVNYVHTEYIINNDKLYHNRFNLHLLNEIYNTENDNSLFTNNFKECLDNDKVIIEDENNIITAKQYCIHHFGYGIYNKIIKGYYEKLYRTNCNDLSKDVIDIVPQLNYMYDNSTYDDIYQGVPEHGYSYVIEKIIGKIPIMLNVDFIEHMDRLYHIANNIIYTGDIDRLLKYCMQPLKWVSIETNLCNETGNDIIMLGNAVVKSADKKHNWYRITEHKLFRPDLIKSKENIEFNNNTILSYEKTKEWNKNDIITIPLLTQQSKNRYEQYKKLLNEKLTKIILCGMKAEYKNMSICDTIESAFNICEKF